MHDLDLDEQYDKIYRYCYFRVQSREMAEDITQEAFLRFLESGSYQSTGKALRYLYTIARNLCIDEYRRNSRRTQGAGGAEAALQWNAGSAEAVAGDSGAGNRKTEPGRAGVAETEPGRADAREPEAADAREKGSVAVCSRKDVAIDGLCDALAGDMEERLVTRLSIRAALNDLDEEAREMILLRYINEVPVGIIGKIFKISRFAVYRKIRESLAFLRERLGEEDFA